MKLLRSQRLLNLADEMGVQGSLAQFAAETEYADVENVRAAYDAMESSMEPCMVAFTQGEAAEFEKCLDPDVVMYTPYGEFVGREQVISYLQNRFFRYAPNVHHTMKVNEVQMIGDALWYSYEYVSLPALRVDSARLSAAPGKRARSSAAKTHSRVDSQANLFELFCWRDSDCRRHLHARE